MQQYENPFSMRASEKMTSDDVFISLFSEASLYSLKDLSEKGKLWGNLTYICSAPGGGKTTMLRFFSPSVIQKVQNNKKENDKQIADMKAELEKEKKAQKKEKAENTKDKLQKGIEKTTTIVSNIPHFAKATGVAALLGLLGGAADKIKEKFD